ncbi:hypothetical protein D3C81_602310 [compost metagenome]
MLVVEGQVALPYRGTPHQADATAPIYFVVEPDDQFMAAGADLKEAPVAQALFIQAFGQQHTVIREWRREIDPSHLWVGSGHRRLATRQCSDREQQCQLAHE